MNESLKEFDELVDMKDSYRPGRGIPEPPDEEAVTKCIQLLLSRQCIYPNQHGTGPYYRIMSTPSYQGFFRKFFSAMGLEFYHETRSGMVALKVPGDAPRFDIRGARLSKDETALLLALRLIYEEGFNKKEFTELATVETTTDDIFDRLQVVGNIELSGSRISEILNFLKRKGVVELGSKDTVDKITPVIILPGIEVVVPRAYIERVRMVAEQAAESSQGTDVANSSDIETEDETATDDWSQMIDVPSFESDPEDTTSPEGTTH